MTSRWLLLAPLAVLLVWASPARVARAQDEPAQGEAAPAPKKKKKPAKKKSFDYEKSKYKSISTEPMGTYRFNDKGEPIVKETKKKAAKKKKRSEPPEAEVKEESESCGLEAGCGDKKSEADAL